MTREQAINYLYSSGMSDEQVMEVVEALKTEPCVEDLIENYCEEREQGKCPFYAG